MFRIWCLLHFVVTDCGGSVKRNCSYIQNEEYPLETNKYSSCLFTIKKERHDICFIRLDFEALKVADVDVSGNCAVDVVSFT